MNKEREEREREREVKPKIGMVAGLVGSMPSRKRCQVPPSGWQWRTLERNSL